MKLTVLFDLDDTLLSNDFDHFLPHYLQKLCEYNPNIPSKQLSGQLLYASQKMALNQDPGKTLEEVFDSYFYPGLGSTKAEMADSLSLFYQQGFGQLRSLTQPRPQAAQVVKNAFRNGWQVVVATNPLFPQTAIYQRLEWAGLPADKFPFTLVTSFENFHFAKPNPAYFAEILAMLGWPEQPTVMVGNSLTDDLVPAAQLGLPIFWLNGQASLPTDFPSHSRSGTVEQLGPWLSEWSNLETPPAINETPTSLLATIRATPAALASLCSNLTPEQWRQSPKVGEWSATEIICHLVDGDRDVHLSRLQKVSHEENPFLPGIDTDAWAEQRMYASQEGSLRLKEFIAVRKQILELLETLPTESWQRPARHAIFGPTSLIELVRFIATHDRVHLRQIRETLSK